MTSENPRKPEGPGDIACRELMDVYDAMRELKGSIAKLHDQYVKEGASPAFDAIEALYLQSQEVFDSLERYLLPACDPNTVVE